MRSSQRTAAQLVAFGDPAAEDPSVVGTKAATLAALRGKGEQVPDGVVVLPDLEAATAARATIERLGTTPMAVRSSSLAEDLVSESYAGQYRTVLDVEGVEAIAAAITDVRASAGDAVGRGYGTSNVSAMPVLVMPMVPADAAGVAFGANPVTGDLEVIVEAVPGLGEALVSGSANPQRFTCRDGQPPVEQPSDSERAITAAQAAEVAVLTRRLGELLGGPQDVEWVIADGIVHLLQSRPVTALPVAPELDLPGPRETWMRADENYSHPVRPLEFSTWAPRLERSFTQTFAEIGAPVETLRYRSIGGWMYARFVPPMDQGKDDQAAPPAWLFGLLMRVVPPFRSRLKRAADVWSSDLIKDAAESWEVGGRDEMRARTRELRDIDRAALTDASLVTHFEEVLDHLQAASDVHTRLPVLATFLPTGHLGVLSERLLGWTPTQTLRLLQGHSTVTHAADALDDVVTAISADGDAGQLLADDPSALLTSPGPGGRALREYLDRYGHRIVGMDLAHPTWAEEPGPVLAMIRARMSRRPSERSDVFAVSREAELQARDALADSPEDLALFDDALAAARRGISYGDDTEADVLEALGLVRYVAAEARRRLSGRGELGRPDDVWFLIESELLAALAGGEVTADVSRRRGEYLWARSHPGPARYGPEPPAFPSMRYAPKAVRPFLEAMVWATDRMTSTAPAEGSSDGVLIGTGASPGRATGIVRVIHDPSQFGSIQPDDVLVCRCTIAAWSVVFPLVSAIVTEVGGPLSHPGILAREFEIPAVLGIPNVTTRLRDGQVVTVDGTTGRVEVEA